MTALALVRDFPIAGFRPPAPGWTGFSSTYRSVLGRAATEVRVRERAAPVPMAGARPRLPTWRAATGTAFILGVKLSMLWVTFLPV